MAAPSSSSFPPAPDDEWENWLASHASRFLLSARQQTRCAADAEDVLQEALVETWRRAGGRPETPLVFATIRRRAIDLARRIDRRALREDAAAAGLDTTTDASWFAAGPGGTSGPHAGLEEELRRLPAPQREAVTLRIWGGLTLAETAAALGIPQGTAASRYRLALEALRQALSPPSLPATPASANRQFL